ncbi:unnamed protein product [Mycena citricolor]|uniref:Uncharacterized protein n=1 Tax=Mycena citricolor TaxID=2018698 RepID=A0AAD2K026_9AGAR|nr:unnamed protein product [Mycena citricolor]
MPQLPSWQVCPNRRATDQAGAASVRRISQWRCSDDLGQHLRVVPGRDRRDVALQRDNAWASDHRSLARRLTFAQIPLHLPAWFIASTLFECIFDTISMQAVFDHSPAYLKADGLFINL